MKQIIACSVLASTAGSFADTYVVEAQSMTFEPNVISVQPGDVIRWEYITGYPHDVTSGTNCTHDEYLYLDIPDKPGGYVEWTVPEDAPSWIPYFCQLHCGGGMTGAINVSGDSDQGHMVIGIVDSSNCEVSFEDYPDGIASISFSSVADGHSSGYTVIGGNFALGVEVEDTDVEVLIGASTGGEGELNVFNAFLGTTSSVVPGVMPLSAGNKYMFTGSVVNESGIASFEFEIMWPEGDDEGGMDMVIDGDGGNSVSSSGDNVMFRASEHGQISVEITVEQDEVMQMAGVANVSCKTLTIPTDGEEGEIEIIAGTHLIVIGGGTTSTPAQMGMLLMQMDGDDDGGDSLPEDVNGDGVVNVLDILAVISAWGATSP